MSFPISFRGRIVACSIADPVVALNRVAAHLRVDGIDRYELTADRLTFAVGLFRGPGHHHPLAMVTRGVVWACPSPAGVELQFQVSLVQAFWIVTAIVLGLFGPFVLGAGNVGWGGGLLIVAGFWLWIYGVNMAITMLRFPTWLAAAAGRESAESAHPKTLFGSQSLAQFLYRRRSH
jgi:hypothetical protein